jgi:hypothetical protein
MDESSPSSRWSSSDWKLVALLALFAVGLRGWQLTHTEVAARDSIGFIRHAWQFRQHDLSEWPDVLRHSEQHPFYPLYILAVSRVLEPFYHGPTADLMQQSAQIASAIAAVLLVLPVFALGRVLFDRRIGFLSVILLQCLPVSGRILADGLSESTFLLFASSALYFSFVALRQTGRPRHFALVGFFGGLAYLTRPEGLVIVAATGLVLLIGQAVKHWRRSWNQVIVGGSVLTVTASLAVVLIFASTGKIILKPSGTRIVNDLLQTRATVNTGPLFAAYNVYDNLVEKAPSARFWWSFKVLPWELMKGSFYVGWIAAVLGLWWNRERFRTEPGAWVMVLTCLVVSFALWRIAVVVGYLSDRHLMLVFLCAIPFAVAGLVALGQRLAAWQPRLAAAPLLLPLICSLAMLPKDMVPLHYERSGFREVGEWLAEHTHPIDKIEDPLCWAHYYAGRVFLEYTSHPVPPGYKAHTYIVIEEAGNSHSRVPTYLQARDKIAKAELVHSWEGKRGGKSAKVLVYALPLAG